MIIKVQMSRFTSDKYTYIYVYNETRSFQWEGRAEAAMIKLMANRPKAFFNATVKEHKFVIDSNAPWQNW